MQELVSGRAIAGPAPAGEPGSPRDDQLLRRSQAPDVASKNSHQMLSGSL